MTTATEYLRRAADTIGDRDSVEDRCTVRVKTTMWSDKRGGLHAKKSLTFLRRRCNGYNLLDEDAGTAGAGEVLPRILNLWAVEDGVYRVVSRNERRDWETGYVEDYDYWLAPDNGGKAE